MSDGRSVGQTCLSVFFAAGAVISATTALALMFPGSSLEPMWRLNPEAHVALTRMGPWAVLLMIAVAIACALAAVGLFTTRRWGHQLAVALIGCNLLGDLTNGILRGDRRTLIGLPIGAALLIYLLSPRTRGRFRSSARSANRKDCG